MTDLEKIELLRDIILKKDRKVLDRLSQQVSDIDTQLNTRVELEPKIEPIIDEKLAAFQEDIPEKMGPAITAALERQINEAQDKVIDILYPIIGKLISKYIRREIEILSEKIDKQFEKAFSIEGWIRRIKGWFSGTKESELMIRELDPPQLVEIFIIEKESGILKAHYANEEKLDADMVAGMLTAIKSFVEDALTNEAQELELIEYDSYKISIKTFKSFYVAMVMSGVLNALFKAKIDTFVLNFIDDYLGKNKADGDNIDELQFRKELKEYFDGENF